MERTDVKRNHTEGYSTDQIRCIEKSDSEYPQIMKQYPSMPAKLYVKGRLPDPKRRTVAVIGARMCSPYGRMQAFRYAKALSVAGVQIISGMALGIDSEGHKGALEGKMPTFAVLGSGVDVCYPKSNRKLYERILWENGGIISECPLGSGPVSWHFPARNRIISALSDAVLVVEAKENSGSLITAGFALEQGKTAPGAGGSNIRSTAKAAADNPPTEPDCICPATARSGKMDWWNQTMPVHCAQRLRPEWGHFCPDAGMRRQ